MTQQTSSRLGFDPTQARMAPVVSRHRHFLLIAASLSVGVHLFMALLITLLPRVLRNDLALPEQGTVELLMVEQKGSEQNPAQPTSAVKQPEDTAAPADAPASKAAPSLPVAADGDSLGSARRDVPPRAQTDLEHDSVDLSLSPKQAEVNEVPEQAKQQQIPPDQREAPVFDLEGTESESNAIAFGSHILPAMLDNRFRNRPPAYPAEAETRGQHGAVVVLIHVSDTGVATGADIMSSSGVGTLDQAAVAAVRKWRFHPAMKAGMAVPFDMPFRFIFEPY